MMMKIIKQLFNPQKKAKPDTFYKWKSLCQNIGELKHCENFTGENKINCNFETMKMFDVLCAVFSNDIFELMVKGTNDFSKKFFIKHLTRHHTCSINSGSQQL